MQTSTPRRFLLSKRTGVFQSTPQPRRGVEDVDDDDDEERVEMSSIVGEEEEDVRGRDVLGDSIEVLSDEEEEPRVGVVPSSEDTPASREAKRRRLSISPLPAFGSPGNSEVGVGEDGYDREGSEDADTPGMGLDDDAANVGGKPRQPTFQPPPRFKQLDAEYSGEGLPAAFSPQRRGAKYLVGGLAAELQGWLSEVKGGDGLAESTLLITVGKVRAGRRMYMVQGEAGSTDEQRRVILAGEGRLTGLDGRATVVAGNVVEVRQPVWDVEVDGEIWMVACDWAVP